MGSTTIEQQAALDAPVTTYAPSDELLRKHGLRVTAQRIAILDALEPYSHLDADQIAAKVRAVIGPTAIQTIYDALTAFTAVGLLRRIEPAGSAMLYERRAGDNHHHIICRRCHTVRDVDCVMGEAPCLTPSDAAGFTYDEAEVIFWGLCPACQADMDADVIADSDPMDMAALDPTPSPWSPHSSHTHTA